MSWIIIWFQSRPGTSCPNGTTSAQGQRSYQGSLHLCVAITLVPLIRFQWHYDFLKAQKKLYQISSEVLIGPDFELFPHAFLSKSASKMTFDFNPPSERAHFKLLENHKIIEIGETKLELWPFK